MSEIIFEIRNLVKKFKSVTALDNISTTIRKGEVVFIVGPSGSGKSTFLRSLNLLEKPTSGEIIFEGQNVTKKEISLNKLRRKVGMVFQHFNLFPNLDIMHNITLAPIKTRRMSAKQANAKAGELLQRIGLFSKYKAYLLPYKEVLPTTGKKLQITLGFHVTKVNVYSEIGYLDHEATFLIGGLLQILFSYAFLFGKQNGFTFHGNTTLFTGDRIDVFVKMQFVFNLLILILAGIKIIINKGIVYAKRKQT